MSRKDKIDQELVKFTKYYYAHRGFHESGKKIYENSLSAFKAAVEKGYGAELDVHLSKDNIPVVFHDHDLNRICGSSKKVADLTYRQLLDYKIRDSEDHIPTLAEVLEIFEDATPLIIEIKSVGSDVENCRYVDDVLKDYRGLYCVQSFSHEIVEWYAKNRPDLVRGQLSGNYLAEGWRPHFFKKLSLTFLLPSIRKRPHFIAYNHVYGKNLGFVFFKKVLKTTTAGWTIRSSEEFEKARKKFDIIIFEGFEPDPQDLL